MTIDEQFEKLENTVREYNPGADFKRIRESYEFAKQHHGEQRRKSGELYITHPLAVAQIVAEELHLDSESIEAALLHDVIEDTDATYDDVAKLTSPTVADLVEGVSKLTRIQYATKEDEQMENLRKMLIAMSKDIRVILIKISDRLHNMRTMEYQTPAKQKQKSLETMEIYAPIAHRLGMQRMKWELEDLSLKYLDPIGYDEIVSKLDAKRPEYDALMSRTQAQIDQRLNEMGIKHIVYGRMKHPYSIYRKMFSQNKSLDEIFDLFAFRVVVDTVSDCYNVLGVIHDLYKPILGRFKDYIGTPKPNGYQSLHTTVMGNEGIPFEVQIRTTEMHEIAEYGVAAHWKYKQNGQGAGTEGKYEWVRRLLENQEGADAEEFIHSLKVDMFADEVFVFTPNGDVQNLPAGATPIDFAYAIHSAVGNRMIGAKVNNRIVTLDHVLKNGDIVEVITSKAAHGPSRDWLSIVKSTQAKNKINQWFRSELKEDVLQGQFGGFQPQQGIFTVRQAIEQFPADIGARLGLQRILENAVFLLPIGLHVLHVGNAGKNLQYLVLRSFNAGNVAEVVGKAVREIFFRVVRYDLTFINNHNPVTDRLNLRQNMRGQNNGMALTKGLDQIPNFDDLLRVEADGGLVQNQNLRITDQRLREADALPVALGKIFDNAVFDVGDFNTRADILQMRFHGLLRLFELIAELQIRLHRHIQIQRRMLGKIADVLFGLDRIFQDVKTRNFRGAGGGRDVSGQDIHRRRFSSAVRPQKTQNFTFVYGEADAVYSMLAAVNFGEVFYLDHSKNSIPFNV